ncbi:MAG: hypothetical protein EPO12_16660 [Aquabacterium sp.]|jgi:hypothetical protein|nr:MAG: hypothetical protein EPO12_16660 [Aquabacterium sp.]
MRSRSGLILILVGSLLLAHNFGLLQWGWLKQWWPALLIVLGLWSIASTKPFDNERPAADRPAAPRNDAP